ncbi:MAG: hypothetical protein DRJ40_03585 [Thermoprotei archaeon]|nr:MAG: hypothetical protein DRJ40_03585 [Thermoprotei archaeon]
MKLGVAIPYSLLKKAPREVEKVVEQVDVVEVDLTREKRLLLDALIYDITEPMEVFMDKIEIIKVPTPKISSRNLGTTIERLMMIASEIGCSHVVMKPSRTLVKSDTPSNTINTYLGTILKLAAAYGVKLSWLCRPSQCSVRDIVSRVIGRVTVPALFTICFELGRDSRCSIDDLRTLIENIGYIDIIHLGDKLREGVEASVETGIKVSINHHKVLKVLARMRYTNYVILNYPDQLFKLYRGDVARLREYLLSMEER